MPENLVRRKCPNCGTIVNGKSAVFAAAVCCPKCRKRAVFGEVRQPAANRTAQTPSKADTPKSPAQRHRSRRKLLALIYILLAACFFFPQYGIAYSIAYSLKSMFTFWLNLGVLYGWSTIFGILLGILALTGLLLLAIQWRKSSVPFSEKLTHLTLFAAICGVSLLGIGWGLTGNYQSGARSLLGNDIIYVPYVAFLIPKFGFIGFLLTLGWDSADSQRGYVAVACETCWTRLPYLSGLRGFASGWSVPVLGWLLLIWFNPNRGADSLRNVLLMEAGALTLFGIAILAVSFWRKAGAGVSILTMAVWLGAGGLAAVLAGVSAASVPYYQIEQEWNGFQEKIRAEAATCPNDVVFPFLTSGGKTGKLTFTYDKTKEKFSRLTIEREAETAKEIPPTGSVFRVSGADLGGTGNFSRATVLFNLSKFTLPKEQLRLWDAILCSGKFRFIEIFDYKSTHCMVKVELPESPTEKPQNSPRKAIVWTWDPLITISGALGQTAKSAADLSFLDAGSAWRYECLGEVKERVLSLTILATIEGKQYAPLRLECNGGLHCSADLFVNGKKIPQSPFLKTISGLTYFRMPPFGAAAAKIDLPGNETVNEVRLHLNAGPFGGMQDLKATLNSGKGF